MLCCTGNAEIIVIDRGNKLTCFEQTGKVKWSLNNAHIMNNITYLENGQIYVCCKDAIYNFVSVRYKMLSPAKIGEIWEIG
jgi:hypothetical protein